MSNRVVGFEIHASDCAKIAEFYRKVFGWRIHQYSAEPVEYWKVITAANCTCETGINGSIVKRFGTSSELDSAINSFVCTITVESIDAVLYQILTSGGSVAVEKRAIPNLAWVAYCRDPDGNVFGIYEPDPHAC